MNENTRQAILAECKAAQTIGDTAEAENRDLTGEERQAVTKHLEMAKTLRTRAEAGADMRRQLDELADGIGLEAPGGEKARPETFHRVDGPRSKTLGDAYVESKEFQDMLKSVPDGRFGEQTRVHSAPFGVKDLLTGANRTTGAGTLLTPDSLGMLDPMYARPLTLRDLVTRGTTSTDTIEYVKITSVTNNAAPVAEATSAAAVGGGVTSVMAGVKPESGVAFEKATTTVKTIAHWMPATKRSLSDAAQVRTLINSFLLYGLDEELEDQILTGNGTGENFLGIGATSGIQTQAVPSGGDTILDTAHKARTKVRLVGRAIPTAYVMNPLDWEKIDLMKDANARYYGAGPFNMSVPNLWGLRVVESEAVAAGTAWVADWSKAVLWDREQASIQATDAHNDFFIRNLVAILAELRAAFAVLRPQAFVKITLA